MKKFWELFEKYRFTVIFIAALLVVVIQCTQADAAVCGSRENFVKELEKDFGEVRVATAIIDPDEMVVMETFVSPEGSFTVLVTNPRMSCVVLAGESYTQIILPLGDGV